MIVLLHCMIGYWHHHSVCLSVCLFVTLCIAILRVNVWVVPACSQQSSSHLSLQTLLLWDVSFSYKTHRKNESKKTRTWVFLRQTLRRALVVLCSVIHWLRELWSVTLEWIEFGCIHKLCPLNRIVRTVYQPAMRASTCNRNRFDSLPIYRRS